MVKSLCCRLYLHCTLRRYTSKVLFDGSELNLWFFSINCHSYLSCNYQRICADILNLQPSSSNSSIYKTFKHQSIGHINALKQLTHQMAIRSFLSFYNIPLSQHFCHTRVMSHSYAMGMIHKLWQKYWLGNSLALPCIINTLKMVQRGNPQLQALQYKMCLNFQLRASPL